MSAHPDSFLSTLTLGELELDLHALDEPWIVPTARAVAAIWASDNARVRLLAIGPDELYLLALDQCLSAYADGHGVVAVDQAGRVVAMILSCVADVIGGNENAVVWIDPAELPPATRAYKAMMDALYEPFVARFRGFLDAPSPTCERRAISYGLKGGVDGAHRGRGLLSLLMEVNFAFQRLSGSRLFAGISTHPVTVAYQRRKAAAGHSKILHQARLADFIHPETGQRPFAEAGDLHFTLGVGEYEEESEPGAVVRGKLGTAGWSRLQTWHARWQARQPARAARAAELAAGGLLTRRSD